MNDQFNIQSWKQKFYLNEEQSGTHKLSSLTWDKILTALPDQASTGIAFPQGTDSMSMVKKEEDYEMWKEKTMKKFGDVNIKLDPNSDWHSKVQIIDGDFEKFTQDSISSKQHFLDRNQGSLDETSKVQLSEADKEKLKAKIKEQIYSILKEEEEDTISSLQKMSDDTAKMPADRDKARNKMYAMKKSSQIKEEEDYEKMGREVEYGIGPDYDEEEIDMEDLFADLDGDFEGMPMDFEPIDEKEEEPNEALKSASKKYLAEKDKDKEVDAEEEVDVDVEEPAMDTEPAQSQGLTAEEQEVQNSLKIAYDNAVSMGDQKLADQIGNSITFFTRTHIVER